MTQPAKVERERTSPSEKPFTQEGAHLYLISLTEKVNKESNEVPRKKRTAEAALKQLNKQQLESLSGAIRQSIDLPEDVKKMVETIDLRMLIMIESRQRREQLKQAVVYDPRTWSKEQVLTGATIGGAVIVGGGLLYGISRFFRRTKEKIKDGTEKVKNSIGWLAKMMLIGGVVSAVTLLGIIGISKGSDFLKKYAEDLKKNLTEKAKKTVDDAARKAQEKIDQSTEKLEAAKQGIALKADAMQESAATKVDQVKNSIESKKNQKNDDGASKTTDNIAKAEEIAKETAEFAGMLLLARGLVSMHPSKDWTISDNVKIRLISEVLQANRKTPMKNIFDSVTRPQRQGPIDATRFNLPVGQSATDRPNRIRAAHFVIDTCFEYREKIARKSSDKPEPIENMPLSQFIAPAIGSHAVVGRVIEKVQESGGDTGKALQAMDFDTDALNAIDSGLKAEFEQFREEMQLRKTDGQVQNVHFFDLIQAARTLTGSVSEITKTVGNTSDTPAEKMIRQLCLAMETEKTYRYMLPFFHQNLPEAEWSESQEKNIQEVKKYLLDRMSVQQAIRMYLYGRMMRKGNPAAIALMQVETTHFTGKFDDNFGGRKWKKQVIEAGKKVWNGSWEELEDVDLAIPREVIMKGEEALKWIIPYAVAGGAIATAKVAEEYIGSAMVLGEEVLGSPRDASTAAAVYLGVTQGIIKPGVNFATSLNYIERPSSLAQRIELAAHPNWKRLRSQGLRDARLQVARALEEINRTLGGGHKVQQGLTAN